jgi:hypothetical protein
MLKIHGKAQDTARLESIMWRKPAFVEITLSQYEDPSVAATVPSLADFTDFAAVFVGSRIEVREGVRRRFFTYRMGQDIPKSPTDRQGTDYLEQWSMNTVLTERGIKKHPDFPTIKKRYNGSVLAGDRVVWPRYIQDPDDETKIIKNPMFGVRGFLAPEVEVSVEKGKLSGTSMDFSQINEVGYVDDPTPTPFAFFAPSDNNNNDPAWATKYANWILVDKSFRVVGVDRIERMVWRNAWGDGWPKAIYDAPSIQGAKS